LSMTYTGSGRGEASGDELGRRIRAATLGEVDLHRAADMNVRCRVPGTGLIGVDALVIAADKQLPFGGDEGDGRLASAVVTGFRTRTGAPSSTRLRCASPPGPETRHWRSRTNLAARLGQRHTRGFQRV
jgi:hypothetical protein